MERRRRTDHLPHLNGLPDQPLDRARASCSLVAAAGFAAAMAVHVPDDGTQAVLCGASGRIDPLIDVARGLARTVAREGPALRCLDSEVRASGVRWRHAAMPIGRTPSGTVVLIVSDTRLARREAQALATWAAPVAAGGMRVRGGPCGPIARALIREFEADLVAVALFAQSGMVLNLHVRTGALLHARRIPSDTIWGEVARHGAAFTLGELPMHAGAELLGSLGMHAAGMVGLENGNGIAIGALGVAAAGDLSVDLAHDLLRRAPALGPEVMARLSSTIVPVPDENGTIDTRILAARVGCLRFAMYERDGAELRLVAAHTGDGSNVSTAPDEIEEQLVGWAAEQGVGIAGEDAAAVLVGTDTVLYAQDPGKRPLECLRLALGDVRRNPFGAEERGDEGEQAADAA